MVRREKAACGESIPGCRPYSRILGQPQDPGAGLGNYRFPHLGNQEPPPQRSPMLPFPSLSVLPSLFPGLSLLPCPLWWAKAVTLYWKL